MRTFAVVVLSVLGGLLLLVGGTVAVVVGPDDTASLPAGEVPAASGVAVTSYDLFPLRDLTLHVSATAEGGPVFVGTAHPVDARDYVAGVEASWVKGVDRTGTLTVDAIAGELPAPEVDPTTTTFWDDSVSGEGTQSLDVELTGAPVTIVVAPVSGPAATTLAFGAVVPRLFALSLGVAGAGALLVAAAVLLRVLGRRRAAAAPGTVSSPQAATPASPEPATTGARMLESRRPTARAQRRRLTVLAAGVAVAVAACVPVPSAVEPPDEPVRVAADEAELEEALASYGERASAASGVAAQLDPAGWADPDTGGRLAQMEYRTKLAAARNAAPMAYTVSYSAVDAAVPEFTSYPMWFLALVEETTDGTPAEKPQLRVFQRDRVTAPWRTSFALDVPADSVQLPEAGSASVATPEQVAAGLAAVELVRQHLESGAEVAVELGDLGTFREDVLGDDLEGRLTLTDSKVAHYEGADDPTAPGGPVQVVPVADGVLVTSSLSYVFNRRMEAGWTLNLIDEAVAAVTQQTGDRQNLRTLGLVRTALHVPDGGTPRVVSAGWGFIAPRV